MIQWQHLFSGSILQRGREYYKQNKVRSLIRDGETYYATVEGTTDYQVVIRVEKDRVSSMSCECPWAEDGNRCKHMAAALYEITARDVPLPGFRTAGRKATDHVIIQPFDENAQDMPYAYYLPSRFTANLDIYGDTWAKAQKLIQEKAFAGVSINNCYTDSRDAHGKAVVAQGTIRKNPVYPVRVSIARDRVISLNCPIYGCRGYFKSYPDKNHMEICEHCLALLLLAVEEIRNHPFWDATDEDARRMLDSFWERNLSLPRKEEENEQERERRTVRLEPRLEESEEGIRLQFRIGTDEKLYVLKSLEELVEAVRTEGQFPLGTKGSLDFSADRFGEKDQTWYELIRQAVLEKKHHEQGSGYLKKLQGIDLYGAQLDSFFDLAAGTELELKTQAGGKRLLEIQEGNPDISLTLRKDMSEDGVFHGVTLEGELPKLLDGVRYHYCLDRQRLARMDGDRHYGLEQLLRTAKGERLNMHIGRSFLPDFYYHVLPELARSVNLTEEDRAEIMGYLPPEVSFSFYLDAQDGVPVCRPAAKYGDEVSFPLTDWLNRGISPDMIGYRDQMQESSVLHQVQAFFPEFVEAGELSSQPDEDSVYRALTDGLDTLCGLGEVLSTARFDALRVRRGIQIQVGVSLESDIMDLHIQSEDVSLSELAEILKSYRLKKKYHRLKNGDFVRMDESIGELAALAETLQLSQKELAGGDISVPAYRALYLDQMLEQTQQIHTVRDRHYRQLIKDFSTVKDSDYELPESLAPVMRGYQSYGYKWLRMLSGCGFGGILADEMGLGKTLQMIAVLLAEKLEGAIGTSLIVCPASLVYNWEEEFHRFAPELSVCPVEGTQPQRREIIERSGKWDVLISSYDHLKRDIACYEGRVFLYEVLDEAQFIKNQSTASAKAVKIISAKHRFALTGTPIENRLSELWSIFDYLMPGFLYGYETFRNDLERPIVRDGDEEASRRLKRMVSPFVLRRLKTEVLKDLPEKVEEPHYVRFGEEQRRLYDAQVIRMKDMLQEETEESFRKRKIQVLAELMRIRQICCDPALLFEDYGGGSAKLEACMDLLQSALEGEHRVLLFSQFTSMLDLLKERLNKEGIRYYEITGATPKKERLRLVSDFNAGDVPVFLISLRAGGTGLNLTGADIVIHYDPWWNAAAQNQATDRAHRIGQQKPVTVYQLLVKDSIEEKIRNLQERKLDLADEIIGGETVSFSSLSREELLELINS